MKLRLILLAAGMLLSSAAFAANPLVMMRTNMGDIVFELFPDKAPKTVANFLRYVNSGHYNGTVFHRTIQKFIIQGGGFTPNLEYKPTQDPIQNEAANGLKNEPGTLAMARTYEPDSATSQFFINLDDNKFLNHHRPHPDYYGYCVFGKVVQGMDVAKKIGAVQTSPAGPFDADVPKQPVIIEQMALASQIAIEEPRLAETSQAAKPGKKTLKRKKDKTHG
jgi:peptidyl-prolyl cis-trans isomerase A (cyclophilin A)/peptidyl-prolyl cis-trans isomerase B (cyclophilin B)